jgi:hypothetical protein
MTSAEKGENVTIMLCGNAEGDFLPPYFIIKRTTNVAKFAENLPSGSEVYVGKSSWQTTDSFVQWLNFFIETVQPEEHKPVLLIVDGHASHKTLDAIELARKHHIHMLALPPYTTNKTQPLDRCFMNAFKKAYDKACEKRMRELNGGKIIVTDVSLMVKNALQSMTDRIALNLIKGFKCTGIEPYDRHIFDEELKKPQAKRQPLNKETRQALEAIMPLPERKRKTPSSRTEGCQVVTSLEYLEKKKRSRK